MKRVDLTETAEDDLRAIAAYTVRTWGEKQKTIYLTALLNTMKTLGLMSGMGRPRHDIGVGLRTILNGRHIILYEEKPDSVLIVRVFHASEDIDAKLNP